jgi:hypothetical protein
MRPPLRLFDRRPKVTSILPFPYSVWSRTEYAPPIFRCDWFERLVIDAAEVPAPGVQIAEDAVDAAVIEC